MLNFILLNVLFICFCCRIMDVFGEVKKEFVVMVVKEGGCLVKCKRVFFEFE